MRQDSQEKHLLLDSWIKGSDMDSRKQFEEEYGQRGERMPVAQWDSRLQVWQRAWKAGRASMRDEAAKECERMMMYPYARQESAAHANVWDAAKSIRYIKP